MKISFDEPNIREVLDQATIEGLDAFNFGIVRMKMDGTVTAYNKYESELSDFSSLEVVGKHYFTQIAPCTNNFMIADKYNMEAEKRDEQLNYLFTNQIKPTKVILRLIIDPQKTHQYLLISYGSQSYFSKNGAH